MRSSRPSTPRPASSPPFTLSPLSDSTPHRLLWLDLARGIAVLAMIGYHFCFDLLHFGFATTLFEGASRDMNHHAGWLSLRAVIVGSFILISGYTAGYAAPNAHSHRKQLWQLGLSALVVSLGSYAIFPDTWIDFGVIHFFFVTRLLFPFLPRSSPKKLAILTTALLLISLFNHPFFDAIPWRWIGLTTHKPFTEDYVPLLPWFAWFVVGLMLSTSKKLSLSYTGSFERLTRPLRWLGQHSLSIYLIHQPLLWGGFMLLASWSRT